MVSPARPGNPLLLYGALPRFDLFETEHVVPGIRGLLEELEHELQRFEERIEPTWTGLVEGLEEMGERLAFAWGLVGHMIQLFARQQCVFESRRSGLARMEGPAVW